MLQHFVTLLTDLFTTMIRGSERPTLSSLDRSINAAGAARVSARRALAVAIAEEEREERRRTSLMQKVTDLEHRAVLSVKSNREDLAIAASGDRGPRD